MTATPAPQTQAEITTTPSLAEIRDDYGPIATCNGFAWNYKQENPHAIVRDALVQGDFHCYIYDPKKDCIIDPMLHQFNGLDDGIWNGDQHPHIDAPHEVREWSDHDEFIAHYDEPFGPYILNN